MKTFSELREKAIDATGTFTATVKLADGSGEDFIAQRVDFTLSDHFIGVVGAISAEHPDEAYIAVALPKNFSGASHKVYPPGKGGAWVYVNFRAAGYAEAGTLTSVNWDQQNRRFSGEFKCKVAPENSSPFDAEGKFDINY